METDATKAQTSKKDDSVRAAEIRKAASEPLLEFVARHGKEAVLDTGGSLLVLEIMLQTHGGTYSRSLLHSSLVIFPFHMGISELSHRITSDYLSHLSHSLALFLDQSAATKTLLELIAAPYPAPPAPPSHPIDSSHVARLYKTLLQGGHFDQSSKSITKPSSSFSPSKFASAFMVTIGRDVIVAMAGGSGAFVIAELCNRVGTEGTGGERELLRTWLTEDGFNESILDKGPKGRNILLESIDSLLST